MSIWFFIWLCMTLIILYFVGWNMVILMRQKRAWKAFAGKHKLRYKGGKSGESSEMSGSFNDSTISLFTGEHEAETSRGTRKLMAIEIILPSKPEFEAGLATGGMVDLLKDMNFGPELKIKHKGWSKESIAASPDPEKFETYLIKERLDALMTLASIKNSWVTLIFRDETALLRFDTPDALDTAAKLNSILDKMTKAAKALGY